MLFRSIVELVGQAVAQTGRIARGLAPVETSGEGLSAALRRLAEDVEDLYGVTCRCEIGRNVAIRDRAKSTQLFRIAQEAVNNAVRHSGCGRIVVELRGGGKKRILTVSDDGKGLARAAGRSDGMGLRIMEHRARMIGGSLRVASGKASGTVVVCTLPTA